MEHDLDPRKGNLLGKVLERALEALDRGRELEQFLFQLEDVFDLLGLLQQSQHASPRPLGRFNVHRQVMILPRHVVVADGLAGDAAQRGHPGDDLREACGGDAAYDVGVLAAL